MERSDAPQAPVQYEARIVQAIICRLLSTAIHAEREIKLNRSVIALLSLLCLCGCASIMSSATSGLAENLSRAIQNQADPGVVRDGAPAYLLMLDSFIEGDPDDASSLMAGAELYALYGAVFAGEAQRATTLTQQALDYGERALCATNNAACGLDGLRYPAYRDVLDRLERDDAPALYSYGLAWMAYIKVHSGDMAALSKLPRAQATFATLHRVAPDYEAVNVAHYLGVLDTVRPPALGGRFDEGRAQFERAIDLSDGADLSVKVDFARYYARTLYERELHDRLLQEVLDADPRQDGKTLFNVLAQEEARELLATAGDHF